MKDSKHDAVAHVRNVQKLIENPVQIPRQREGGGTWKDPTEHVGVTAKGCPGVPSDVLGEKNMKKGNRFLSVDPRVHGGGGGASTVDLRSRFEPLTTKFGKRTLGPEIQR